MADTELNILTKEFPQTQKTSSVIVNETYSWINNAGFYIGGQLYSEDEGILEEMMKTNVYSAYYLTRGLVEDNRTRQGSN
jgi:short-subunit dehydrogenase